MTPKNAMSSGQEISQHVDEHFVGVVDVREAVGVDADVLVPTGEVTFITPALDFGGLASLDSRPVVHDHRPHQFAVVVQVVDDRDTVRNESDD